MSSTIKSHEVLREAIDPVGVKAVALELRVSPALVYKWCQESGPGDSGARNPLDRVIDLLRITNDMRPLNWLCNRTGGFFVMNPDSHPSVQRDLLMATQEMVKHFSEVLDVVTGSIDNDGYITADEARKIRREWEELKGRTEQFVHACEVGEYRPPATDEREA